MNLNLKNIDKRKKRNKKGKSSLKGKVSFTSRQFKAKEKEVFFTELEVLIKAGLDLKESLDLIVENTQNKKHRTLLNQIRILILNGESLSNALKESQKFTLYEIKSIKIAEETGKLTDVLKDLAIFHQRNLELKKMLINTLTYPLLVIFVAFFALFFLLNFLIPVFGEIYSRLDQELPFITQSIISFSSFLKTNSLRILLITIIIGGFLYYNRKKEWLRKFVSMAILKIPVFGLVIKESYLARFCEAMKFLLGSKVPLINSIELTSQIVKFYPLEQALVQIKRDILEGNSLNKSLLKHNLFDPKIVSLLKVGEETHQLELMFSKLAYQLRQNTVQKTKLFGTLLEPILIIFLAITIGTILVAMYLPIFKLVTNIG